MERWVFDERGEVWGEEEKGEREREKRGGRSTGGGGGGVVIRRVNHLIFGWGGPGEGVGGLPVLT